LLYWPQLAFRRAPERALAADPRRSTGRAKASGPNPFRRIVVITDFSDCAKTALMNALWLAEADLAELVQVISIHTPFMQARALPVRDATFPNAVRRTDRR
jgi:hypothetical protein